MKQIKTYFLVADEKEARLLENHGVGNGIFQVSFHTAKDSGVAPRDFADQPVSAQGASGQSRHGVDPVTTERENARNMFAAYVVGLIEEANKKGQFDRLVLCASPHMLGELRSRLSGKVEVHADLDKNLVHAGTDDLVKHFSDIVDI